MKLRKRYLPVAAVLGAAVAIVPALALAGTPEVKQLEINENCVEADWPCWAAPGSSSPALKVTIAVGGEVMFTDHASTAATVVWTGSAPTMCSGIPASATIGWEGKCEFKNPGTYKFESSTLFDNENTPYGDANYTKYEVVVAGAPTDATTSASGETQTEAMLNGSIDPEGNTVEYHFEYEGPGVTGKQSTPTATLSAADFTSHSVSAQVTSLQPGMTYHFLLVASYGAAKTVAGATTQTFTTHAVTAPTATTLAAEGLKETEATLKGMVNPGGEAAEYFFEYGTDTHYGQKTEKATLSASGGNQGVSATLKDLIPGTEYHFRLVAKNTQGPAEGLDHSFKTTSPPTKEPSPTPTPTTPTVTTTSTQPSSGGASTAATPGSMQTPPPPGGGSPLATLALANAQHGDAVHGTVQIPAADGGARLEVQLLTQGASLAKVKRSSSSRVGRLVRSSTPAGTVSFTVALDAQAKRALRRHHKLALAVKIVLTPKHGAAMTLTRSVVVR